MSETLDALHRAVIASPTDRTVRLVYADALDESGDPAFRTRAEFIRLQIEKESWAHADPKLGVILARCSELFDSHWLSWWAPVAETAGLPHPHVPGKRIRDRIARTTRRRRHRNWPYTFIAPDTVHLADYGLSFRFVGGFPEEVRFGSFDLPEGGPVLAHDWGKALPLARLTLEPYVGGAEWERIHGRHLQHLNELSLQRLVADCVPRVAASPYLANLSRLLVNPVGSDPLAFRAIVSQPTWGNLRVLRFTGRLSPDNVRDVAVSCSLQYLEELELGIGNPGLLGEPAIEVLGTVLRAAVRAMAFPLAEAAPRWVEFGPALESLASAKWIKQLRVLSITSGSAGGLIGRIAEQIQARQTTPAETLPEAPVLALAAALDRDKLERLVLPAALVSPSAREGLTRRMGSTVEFR